MTSRAPNPSTGSRKISFNVSEQYDIQDVVGEGAYGVVWYVMLIYPAIRCPFQLHDLNLATRQIASLGYHVVDGSRDAMWQGCDYSSNSPSYIVDFVFNLC